MVPGRLLSALFGLASLVLLQLVVRVAPDGEVALRAPGPTTLGAAAALLAALGWVVLRAARLPAARRARGLQRTLTWAAVVGLVALLLLGRERLLTVLGLYASLELSPK